MESLGALALLEATATSSPTPPDRLGLFMPFVADTLTHMHGTTFTVADLQRRISKEFDLDLPQAVVRSLLVRCCSDGTLNKLKGERYRVSGRDLPLLDLASKREVIEVEQRQLIASLVEYAAADGIGYFDSEEISRQLASYLDESFKLISIGDTELPPTSSSGAPHTWIGRFLLKAKQDNAPEFDIAVRLARGRIYYNAAFLPESNMSKCCFENTIIFLDSPVVCDALGYSSYAAELYAKEVLSVLQLSGARCYVLDKTANEISRVLTAIYSSWGYPREEEPPDSYSFWLMRRGFDKGQIWRWAQDPGSEIYNRLGIEVADYPQRSEEHVASEELLAKRLLRQGGSIDDPRIWHDVDCVAAVLTKRGGSVPRRVHSASHYFAGNSPLTIAHVQEWWREDERRDDIPPMVAASDLAAYAWLNGPVSANDTYSENALLASCAAATTPSERVWADCRKKLDQFVADGEMREDVARAFLFSSDIRLVLAESEQRGRFQPSANGDVDVDVEHVINETIERIALERFGGRLNQAEAEIVQMKSLIEKSSSDEEAANRAIDELRKAVEERDEKLIALRDDSIKQRNEVDEARIDCQLLRENNEAQVAHLYAYARKKARRISNLIISIGVILFIGGLLLVILLNPDGSLDVSSILSIVVGLLMIPFGMVSKCKSPLRERIEHREITKLIIDGNKPDYS